MDNKEPLSDFEKMASEIGKDDSQEKKDEVFDLDEISIVEDAPVVLPKVNEEHVENKVDVNTSQTNAPMESIAKESAPKEETPIKTDNFKFQENLNMGVELPKTTEEKKVELAVDNAKTSNAQTIGTLKVDKQKSPVAMVVLFSLLGVFVLFMPYILTFVNNVFGTNIETHTGVNVSEDDNKKEEEVQKISMYDLNSDTIISIDKIDFLKFEKNNDDGYKIIFYVKNNGTTMYSFDKQVYLEYYDDEKTFVGRSYLEDVKDISGGIENKYVVNVSSDIYEKASKVEVVLRTIDDYPNVEVKDNQITCSNSDDTLVYTFENNRLISIRDMYTYVKKVDIEDYNNDLLTYKSKISSLDKYDGITAVLTETDSGFITSILIDYQNADYANVSSNKNYYRKDTYARVISFEMSAKNYTCR